jgi:transglutaminase-like putative cysteine protease
LLVVGLGLAAPGAASAQMAVHARLDRMDRVYDLHSDLTYVETITADVTVLTARGIREGDRASRSFAPRAQSLEVLEAWVDEPDGTRIPVGPGGHFTRPSAATESAPGFSGEMTTTVLFPQLREGSRTHVVWRLTQRTPPLLGFNVEAIAPLETPVGEAGVSIVAPENLDLHWTARGGFAVTETASDGVRRIAARLGATEGEAPERDMVDAADFAPLFLLTSLPDLRELGAIYWRQSHGRARVTPAIAALAARLAGGRTGLDAVRAIYNWVAANTRYVAVYLDPNDGWVPHEAADVLARGYGDCKDHVVLMQALLGALGIPAEAALVSEGNRARDLPLWVPQFNHAILYLPTFGRFANPTDPFARFDSIDRLLAGKTAVLATEHGAVVHLPPERPADNTYQYEAEVAIEPDGSIDGTARLLPSANLETAARAAIATSATPGDLVGRLLDATPEGGFGTLTSSDPRDLSRPFALRATWRSPHAIAFDDAETLLTVPIGPDLDPPTRLRRLLTDRPRRHPLMTAARDFRWTTTISVPAGYVVTRLPRDVAVRNTAGLYTATYERAGRDVRVARRLVVERTLFEPAAASDLEALVYAPMQDMRAMLGLTRAEAEGGLSAAP